MEHTEKTILVTWDFSNVAEYAMQHAIRFAKIIDSKVALLHIVDSDKAVLEVEPQLKIVSEDAEKKYGFKPEYIIS